MNFLRASIVNPDISAELQLNGQFYFNQIPLAPPVFKVVLQDKTTVNVSWSPKVAIGWYIGEEQYNIGCCTIYVTKICAERIGNITDILNRK